MQLIVSARNFDLSDALRQHVDEQFGSLDKYEPRVSRIEVKLLEEKNRRDVEVLCRVDRSGDLHAEGEAGDFRTAIDQASDRLARQLRKVRSRHRDHQGPTNDVVEPGDVPDLTDEELP